MSEPLELARALEQLAELIAERVLERQEETGTREAESVERSPWLSVESAARYLNSPLGRLYKLTASGEVPHSPRRARRLAGAVRAAAGDVADALQSYVV